MKDLTDKILALLKEEGVKNIDVRETLSRSLDDIEMRLWIKTSISLPLLYNLKDTIWYNLEHLTNGGQEKGLDDLRFVGSKYPTLMFTANDSFYIENEKINDLLIELENIIKSWSNNWTLVQLYTKSADGWNGGSENPSPVIIYDPNKGESPTKYGYKFSQRRSGLIDHLGNNLETEKYETVLCSIEMKLGTYGKEPLMKGLLYTLIDSCKRALKENKGIMLDVESYNYS